MYDAVVMSRKYQIDWIQKMATSHLKSQWPLTLASWDRIANIDVSDALASEDPESWEPDDSVNRLPEPVTAIRLARECGVPEIIPLAFFHLLRQPLEIYPDGGYDDLHSRVWPTPERQLLTAMDLKQLVLARERIGRWFSSRRDQAWGEQECCVACEATVLRTRNSIATEVARNGNVLAASQWVLQDGAMTGICPKCRTRFRYEIRKQRHDFFQELPAFFQL
jgi:hypothetical protein